MSYYEIVGLVAIALIALFSFTSSLKKSIKEDRRPIEELNRTIIELNANFKNMIEQNKVRDDRITHHGRQIDSIEELARNNATMISNHELRIDNLEKKINK